MQLHGRALTSHVWGPGFNPQHNKNHEEVNGAINPSLNRALCNQKGSPCGDWIRCFRESPWHPGPHSLHLPQAASSQHHTLEWSSYQKQKSWLKPPPQPSVLSGLRWLLTAGLPGDSWLLQFSKHLYLPPLGVKSCRFPFCVYQVMWRLFLLNFLVVTNDTDFERQSKFTSWDKPHLFIASSWEGLIVRILLSPSAPTGDASLCHLECPSPVLLLMFYWP